MKWLAAGLTGVNFATVSALLLGMVGGGLNRWVALAAMCLGTAAALIAWFTTCNPTEEDQTSKTEAESLGKQTNKYRNLGLWFTAACFAIFALRSFCWLLYLDGGQLKIQSPNNLGDLALHLTYINEFANGVSLWPDNPIFLFGKLRYPAGTDLFNALLTFLGWDITNSLVWAGLVGSLATFFALRFWGGAFAVAGFLFNGGLVGLQVLLTFDWIDYQGVPSIAWKSIPLAMFVTQRGLLYALPAGLLLLCQWRAKFFSVAAVAKSGSNENRFQRSGLQQPPLPFWVEFALYASMPLFHVHTFLALSIVLGFWFLSGTAETRKQLLLLGGGALLPATFFVWLISDNFRARSMITWHPGWARSNPDFARPFVEFWLVNFGIFIPIGILLIVLCAWRAWKTHHRLFLRDPVLAFLLPAAGIFVFACLFKTAVWEWDNTKLIIWTYLILLPFLWRELITCWQVPIRAGVCFALFASGFVSLFGGLAAGKPGYDFANRAELDLVGVALRQFRVEARFAAFPTYNHPLLLHGRKVALGYPGHLWTQGFDYTQPMAQLTALMQGAPNWREIVPQLRVRYLFWGSDEKTNYAASTRPWEQSSQPIVSGTWGAIYDLEQTMRDPAIR